MSHGSFEWNQTIDLEELFESPIAARNEWVIQMFIMRKISSHKIDFMFKHLNLKIRSIIFIISNARALILFDFNPFIIIIIIFFNMFYFFLQTEESVGRDIVINPLNIELSSKSFTYILFKTYHFIQCDEDREQFDWWKKKKSKKKHSIKEIRLFLFELPTMAESRSSSIASANSNHK